jgi:hypothetical protein
MPKAEYPYIYKQKGKWYFRGGGVMKNHPSECELSRAMYNVLHHLHIKHSSNKWKKAAEKIDGPTPYLDYFASISDAKAAQFDRMIIRKRGKDACWPWRGKPDPMGYGKKHLFTLGRSVGAHRAAFAFFHVVEPGDGFVCHHCDNPICCRPDHLYLGDAQTNSDDRVSRDRVRFATGERASSAKLTQEQAEELRALFQQGVPNRDLQKMFGLASGNISKIGRNLAYRSNDQLAKGAGDAADSRRA